MDPTRHVQAGNGEPGSLTVRKLPPGEQRLAGRTEYIIGRPSGVALSLW